MSRKIVLIEPFYGGSHKQWIDQLKLLYEKEGHHVTLLSLPARHWKWRMYGAAVQLAAELKERQIVPDVLIASDMLDLAAFLGMTYQSLDRTKVILYFHENQLTYPWSADDADVQLNRDKSYAYINYRSALSADEVYFNSQYHKKSFLEALPVFLKAFPDGDHTVSIESLSKKSETVYLGMRLKELSEMPVNMKEEPVILWNHRWEYDKNPKGFYQMLLRLREEGVRFKLIICGESTGKIPEVFDRIKNDFEEEIVYFGYASSREEYHQLLKRSKVLPVTNYQDFFGGSIVEAMAAGCIPVLPDRLAYGEHVPKELRKEFLFSDKEQWYQAVKHCLIAPVDPLKRKKIVDHVMRYDWNQQSAIYLDWLK